MIRLASLYAYISPMVLDLYIAISIFLSIWHHQGVIGAVSNIVSPLWYFLAGLDDNSLCHVSGVINHADDERCPTQPHFR